MHNFNQIHDSLIRHNNLFKEIERMIIDENDIIVKIKIIEFLYEYMSLNHPGLFYSSIIEKELLTISSTIDAKLTDCFKKKSFLHVMTEGSESGGHTRVVERWIKNSDSFHSVIFTSHLMKNHPLKLKDIVEEKNGELLYCDSENPLEKAKKLRELSSHYEFIVLHVHMFDSIPILAFGTDGFKRPIICYNHSQHTLWLGASVVDLLLEITTSIIDFSKRRRGIKNNQYVGIPVDKINSSKLNKKKAKKKLNISIKSKVILSIGRSYKYLTINDINFCEYIDSVLQVADDNIIFIIVGVSENHKDWHELKNKYGEKLILPGLVRNEDLSIYYDVADLYVDSFPVPGGVAFIDALIRKINVVSLHSDFYDIDFKGNAKVLYSDLVKRTISLIKENVFLFNDDYTEIQKGKVEKWVEKTEKIIRTYTDGHKINTISINDKIFEKYDYLWHEISKKCLLFNISKTSKLKILPPEYKISIIKLFLAYIDDIEKNNIIMENCVKKLKTSLYIDTGNDFNQYEVIKTEFFEKKSEWYFSLKDFIDIRNLRFDPCEDTFCMFKIKSVKTDGVYLGIESSNSNVQKDGWDIFYTNDPLYIFKGNFSNATWIKIKGQIKLLSNYEITRFINLQKGEKNALIQKIKRLLSHPITGPVIKSVRWLKDDYSFGNFDKNNENSE